MASQAATDYWRGHPSDGWSAQPKLQPKERGGRVRGWHGTGSELSSSEAGSSKEMSSTLGAWQWKTRSNHWA